MKRFISVLAVMALMATLLAVPARRRDLRQTFATINTDPRRLVIWKKR